MKKELSGFMGNILRINLSNMQIQIEELDIDVARKYLSGTGYATKILWDEMKGGIDPLGPENKIVYSAGLFTGTGCPGSDSLFSCFKSPLTNCWGESRCGGGMGIEMKKAGFDLVVIEGRSDKPAYLYIKDGYAEICSAGHIWGKLVPETQAILKKEINDPKACIACIGPAGERLIKFSNIMVENLRSMGRCGGGAVMGSKNLKAVVFRGSQNVNVSDPDTLKSLIREMTLLETQHPVTGISDKGNTSSKPSFRNGTASFLPVYDELGETPTKNALSNSWGKGADMYDTLKKHIIGNEGCLNCVLRCGKKARVKEGKWQTPIGHYPEYETMVGFGHYLLNDDVEAIIHMNHLCNCYGVDTISCANALAFTMEGYEKGWVSKEDLDGIELMWGNMDAAKAVLGKIFKREGFGDILADGVRIAAAKIGGTSEEAAMHVKGLELPAHDNRSEDGGKVWVIQYGTGSRGMCHVHPHEPVVYHACYEGMPEVFKKIEDREKPYSEKDKGKIVKWAQDYGNAINTLGLCNFHSYLIPGADPIRYTKVIRAVSGWEIDFSELIEIGERISNLQRCFNVREGIRRKDDIIPKRLMQKPTFGPFSKREETEVKDYGAMLDDYYLERGWDPLTGIPSAEKLKELDIEVTFNY